jgi:hypothetical protein
MIPSTSELIIAEPSIGQMQYLLQIQSINGGHRPPFMALELEQLTIELPALEKAVAFLVKRHESVRTIFPVIDGDIRQVVLPDTHTGFRIISIDISTATGPFNDIKKEYYEKAVTQFACIGKGPLVKFFLFKNANGTCNFSLLLHHLICDEWSLNILKNELYEAYQAYVCDSEPDICPLQEQLRHYCEQQNKWLAENKDNLSAYWNNRLQEYFTLFDPALYYRAYLARKNSVLPSDMRKVFTRQELTKLLNYQDAVSYTTVVTGECFERIREISQANGYSIAAVIYASFYIFLYAYTGKQKILLASLLADRLTHNKQQLVGCLLGGIYLPVNDLIEEVYRDLLISSANIIFDHDYLDIDGKGLRVACDIYVNYIGQRNTLISPAFVPDKIHVEDSDVYYAVNCQVAEYDNGFSFRWRYNPHLFNKEVIEDAAECYEEVLNYLGKNNMLAIKDIVNLTWY